MEKAHFELNIFLHSGVSARLAYYDTKENVDDIVSKIWYEGFLDVNPDNPKRKIHIKPEAIRHIEIRQTGE